MERLEFEIKFMFTKDYITANRFYTKGTVCDIVADVVMGEKLEFLFDIDSRLAKKYGVIFKD